MKPFSKILVPLDFLPHSAEAVRRAMELADQCLATVVLLYVYEPGEYPMPPVDIVYDAKQLERMTAKVRARLEAVRRDVDPVGRRRVATRVLQGSPARAIIDAATREPFDLIVMGTHGRTGVERFVLGSVAEEVMRRAPCAVLTVKTPRQSVIEGLATDLGAPSRWSLGVLASRWAPHPVRPIVTETVETTHVRSHLPPSV
jgi:nucleotide-binding universal stress UspA family protein